jgi:hypothetical protein
MLRYGWVLLAVSCGGETTDTVAREREALSEGCRSADATAGFVTAAFERQDVPFEVEFDATPTVAPTDALVGVVLGAASQYRDLAAIVRFNPSGFMDARNGNGYQATTAIPYSAGVTKRIHLSVDPIAGRYSAFVDHQQLALGFAFRSEQAGAVALDGLALKVDGEGALSVCNARASSGSNCESAAPGQGFVNTNLPPTGPAYAVSFFGVPRAANMDGVMGISPAAATSFPELAGAVRFGPSGRIEALNGSSYAPIGSASYVPNHYYSLTIVADALHHTYTVVGPGFEDVTRDLAFRPQQANAASLANFAKVSDSAAGLLTVCELRGGGAQGAAWIHDASRFGAAANSLAVSNDRLLLSDARRTLMLDAAGAVVREIPYGGTSLADADGNLYLFGTFRDRYDGGTGPVYPTAEGGNVYISKYDSDFKPLYTRVTGTTADAPIHSPSADGHGHFAFVLRDGTAVKLDASGEVVWSSDEPVTAVALDVNGDMLVGINQPGAITLSKLDAAGSPLWQRTFPTEGASLDSVVLDSRGGAAFLGEINGRVEFGATTFTARTSEDGNQGLIGSLAPDGAPRFIRTTTMQLIRRAIADGAGNLIVVGTHVNPFQWYLDRYDADGALRATSADQLLPGLSLGSSGDVAIDSAGHVYWQVFPWVHGSVTLNYLAKLSPI